MPKSLKALALTVALLGCGLPGFESQARDGSAPTAGCAATDDVLAGLRLTPMPVGTVAPVQDKVAVRPRWAVLISGRCAVDLVGSKAGYFQLKSGATVELSSPVQDPQVGLRRSQGHTLVDSAEVVSVPDALRKSSIGQLISLTSALDPSANIDRHAAVWARPTGSLIGFLDMDKVTGRHISVPLFEVPIPVKSAHYLASPDTNSGDLTILGPVTGGMKVITIAVDM